MFNHAKIAFLEKIITEHERVIQEFNMGKMNYSALIFLNKTHRKIKKYIDTIPNNSCGLDELKLRFDIICNNVREISKRYKQ